MNNINITIPEPCHESWDAMTPTEKGRFCQLCTKEVIDFTKLSDEQIIKHLNSNGTICGRFSEKQLNKELTLTRKKHPNYFSFLFSGLFSFALLHTVPVVAQGKPRVEQTDKKYTSIPLKNTLVKDSITVSGTIVDENNIPLPEATILIKGSTNGTSTDYDGKYTIEAKYDDIFQVSYVGYLQKDVTVTKSNINLQLEVDDSNFLGEIVVVEAKKRWFGGNLFTRFTNIFRRENKNPKYRHKIH